MEDRQTGIEEKLVNLLKEKGYTVSTAESCTGGLIASEIVNVAGCSQVFGQGFITYANEAKIKYLNVNEKIIEKYGVVSKETVEEMALGCAMESKSNTSIVTSGIAGPDGGTKEKPVGLVWMAVYIEGKIISDSQIFTGNRNEIRNKAANYAINMLIKELDKI